MALLRELKQPQQLIEDFRAYLLVERGFSENTLQAYCRDARQLMSFLAEQGVSVNQAKQSDVESFLIALHEASIASTSQGRIFAGIGSFFRFLRIEGYIEADPMELLDGPRREKHLPDVLTVSEIDALISAIDLTRDEGQRNRAIVETLYGSGLRVSELCSLTLGRTFLDEQYLLVEGKGSKQRIVPLSPVAVEEIRAYLPWRERLSIKPEGETVLFLNRRGRPLSRVMVFYIIRDAAREAGITKHVSPHTMRHSFATHLLEGGANLRAIQEMLGHENLATTELYVHLDTSRLRSELLSHHPHFRN